jgi:hypothetical protein
MSKSGKKAGTGLIQAQNLPQVELLKPWQEIFIKEYINGNNATKAYAIARGLDLKDPIQYNLCGSKASSLLKSRKVCARIGQILNLAGFNEQGADKELNYLIHQHHDLKTKLGAIKEFNALKQRVSKHTPVFTGNTFNLSQILQQANETAETAAGGKNESKVIAY